MTSMAAWNYQFVHLYSRVSSSTIVVLTVNPAGNSGVLIVFNRIGLVCSCELTEENMLVLKNGCCEGLPWNCFFDILTNAFIERGVEFNPPEVKITVKHERQTAAIPFPPFRSSLLIQMPEQPCSNLEFVSALTENMLTYIALRVDTKRQKEILDELGGVERELNEEMVQKNYIHTLLHDQMGTFEKMKHFCKTVDKETQDVVKNYEGDKEKLRGIISSAASDRSLLDKSLCRITDPLEPWEIISKDLNVLLIKYIKSNITYLFSAVHIQCVLREPFAIPLVPKDELDDLRGRLQQDPLMAQFVKHIGDIHTCEFDVFRFQNCCKAMNKGKNSFPGAFFYVGYAAFNYLGLIRKFSINEFQLIQWLRMLEETLDKNPPFHTSVTAAMYVQDLLCFLIGTGCVTKLEISDADKFALVVAACMIGCGYWRPLLVSHGIIKDVDSLFAGECTIEQQFVARLFELMKLDRYNIFVMMETEVRVYIETTIRNILCATETNNASMIIRALGLRVEELIALNYFSVGDGICKTEDCLLVLCSIMILVLCSYTTKKETLFQRVVETQQKDFFLLLNKKKKIESKTCANLSNAGTTTKLHLTLMNCLAIPVYSVLNNLIPSLRNLGPKIVANKMTLLALNKKGLF